ncbi:YdcF family protein [Risungbinella massiliensis]|uniref:YdcF family protein n=1 Tax=Risungbinella massiliensis TaxID=1329796 RepID=UPI0009E5ACC8|nr:YdcF family protein [Risungbinella massiliensis]
MIYSAYSIWSFSKINQLHHADAAIVLGAAVWNDKPSPVLEERINHAIWLYQNGYVKKIIFTGASSVFNKKEMPESEVSRQYAIDRHVDPQDILIETKSIITEQNIRYAYEVAQKDGLKSFIIVSDPLHMKRSLAMAENLNMEAYSSPTPSSVYKTWKTKIPFFLRELFFYMGYSISASFLSFDGF